MGPGEGSTFLKGSRSNPTRSSTSPQTCVDTNDFFTHCSNLTMSSCVVNVRDSTLKIYNTVEGYWFFIFSFRKTLELQKILLQGSFTWNTLSIVKKIRTSLQNVQTTLKRSSQDFPLRIAIRTFYVSNLYKKNLPISLRKCIVANLSDLSSALPFPHQSFHRKWKKNYLLCLSFGIFGIISLNTRKMSFLNPQVSSNSLQRIGFADDMIGDLVE